MNHEQKLAFIAAMTDKALNHVASTPNIMTPKGGMSHDKMLSFVSSMAKNGLEHFASGGTTLSGPASPATTGGDTTSGGVFGGLSGLIGTANNFQASSVPIQAGTNVNQLNKAYTGAQQGIKDENSIAGTLKDELSGGVGSQNFLRQNYENQINGTGPSPAQAALNQNTQQNISQQAALAANTRGAGSNAGLIAVNNAQQGAATEQQAVGQEATLKAEEQLAAENNLQNLAGSQVAQGTTSAQQYTNAQQNEQNILQSSNTANNNANVALQSNINNVNAGVSAGNAASTGNVFSSVVGSASDALSGIGSIFAKGGTVMRMDKGGNVLDAKARAQISPDNFALPGGRYPIHDLPHARNALARVSQNGTPAEKSKVKSAVHKKYPSLAGKKNMAEGGTVEMEKATAEAGPYVMAPRDYSYASGGIAGQPTSGPKSYVGEFLNSAPVASPIAPYVGGSSPSVGGQPAADPLNFLDQLDNKEAKDEDEDSDNSPLSGPVNYAGPDTLGGSEVLAASGGLMKKGGRVKASGGEKAEVADDSLKNDKVPAMLSEDEIVLPRHITMHPNAPAMAAKFVAEELAKRRSK